MPAGAHEIIVQLRDPLGSSEPNGGLIVKLVGRVKANTTTGQLTTTFENQPQTPFEEFRLNFKGGATGSLETSQSCGTTTIKADLTPWSTPGTPDAIFEEPSLNVTGCAGWFGSYAEKSTPAWLGAAAITTMLWLIVSDGKVTR